MVHHVYVVSNAPAAPAASGDAVAAGRDAAPDTAACNRRIGSDVGCSTATAHTDDFRAERLWDGGVG